MPDYFPLALIHDEKEKPTFAFPFSSSFGIGGDEIAAMVRGWLNKDAPPPRELTWGGRPIANQASVNVNTLGTTWQSSLKDQVNAKVDLGTGLKDYYQRQISLPRDAWDKLSFVDRVPPDFQNLLRNIFGAQEEEKQRTAIGLPPH